MLELYKGFYPDVVKKVPLTRFMSQIYQHMEYMDNVEMDSFCCGIDMLGCDGNIDWHRDIPYGPYSGLVVLRNSGVGVQTKRVGPVYPDIGDLMIMNIHRLHRTVKFNPNGRLICLAIDFSKKPMPEQIREKLDEAIAFYDARPELQKYLKDGYYYAG